MKTIIKKKQIDPRAIHESLQKGQGIEHPERISGYAAFFMSYGDIIVSDLVAGAMARDERFRDFVMTSLQEFQGDDYGMISVEDYYCNIEDKWIAGGGDLFGRYSYGKNIKIDRYDIPEAIIKIRMYKDNTFILYDSEPDWLIKEYWEQMRTA